MSWATVQVTETGELHVVPWDDRLDVVANEHHLTTVCGCQPRLLRDGPLDVAVISHRDPGWPGSSDTLS